MEMLVSEWCVECIHWMVCIRDDNVGLVWWVSPHAYRKKCWASRDVEPVGP